LLLVLHLKGLNNAAKVIKIVFTKKNKNIQIMGLFEGEKSKMCDAV
jgi:hypothetical protein